MFRRKNQMSKATKWIDSIEKEKRIREVNSFIQEKLEMIQLTEEDLHSIACIHPLISEHVEELVDEFYATILKIEELRLIIDKNSSVEKLRRTLRDHLLGMFTGILDSTYFEKRLIIAKVHYRIGLKPSWYMGAFQNLQHSLFHVVVKGVKDPNEFTMIWSAITKILSLEQQLVLEAYNEENDLIINRTFDEGKRELQDKIYEVCNNLVAVAEATDMSVDSLISRSKDLRSIVHTSHEQAVSVENQVEEGKNILSNLLNDMGQVEEDTQSMRETVIQLNDSSKEITNVIQIVHAIADQTNLLALNSAIEAARAGEHGKGFSVVAQEVRKLAEKTKQSVTNIQTLIDTSFLYTQEVADRLSKVEEAVKSSANASKLTDNTFSSIQVSINENEQNLSNVNGQINELLTSIEQIGKSMSEVATSAEELKITTQK